MQTVHEYDNAEYPFTDFVCDALGVAPAELAKLHETPAGAAARFVQLLATQYAPDYAQGCLPNSILHGPGMTRFDADSSHMLRPTLRHVRGLTR